MYQKNSPQQTREVTGQRKAEDVQQIRPAGGAFCMHPTSNLGLCLDMLFSIFQAGIGIWGLIHCPFVPGVTLGQDGEAWKNE
jgi:hypothetical protein